MSIHTMQHKYLKIFDFLAIVALIASAVAGYVWAAPSDLKIPVGAPTAIREEIQRYMGYEILPVRYLSLPYDLVMNVNERLPILDNGILLLAFVPLLLLAGLRKFYLQLLAMLSCLFLLVISTANGYIAGLDGKEVIQTDVASIDTWLKSVSFADAPVGVTMATLYKGLIAVYQPIYGVLSKVSGDQDAITYPLLLLFFGLFFYVLQDQIRDKALHLQSLYAFVFVYLFFWLMLSSGIVWYGLLVFPLILLLVFSAVHHKTGIDAYGRFLRYSFYAVLVFSVIIGFAQRFSNINVNLLSVDPLTGKRLYDPANVRYLTGDATAEKTIDAFYPNLSKALKVINQETSSLIFNVGGRFNFFIRENNKRILNDNQLDFFQQIHNEYPDPNQIPVLLKAGGFQYVIIDLNTTATDKTPEKTLVKKYENLLLTIYKNPAFELLATDRTVKEVVNGQEKTTFSVFGDVKNFGTYAVYRIK